MGKFDAVYDKLSQALDDMPYVELGISIEVKEQVSSFPFELLAIFYIVIVQPTHMGRSS